MHPNQIILRELVKRGYARRGKSRIWELADSKLWYFTPELAKGFLAFSSYKPYQKHVYQRELSLIKKRVSEIINMTECTSCNLIDLGCGDGVKAAALIKNLPKGVRVRYSAVDISNYFISEALRKIKAVSGNKVSELRSFVSDFNDLGEILGILRNNKYRQNIILLLGETISHYEINDFLYTLSKSMLPGDYLIVGNGVRRGKRFVNLSKYRTPLFNQWFIHIMYGLGFSSRHVSYDVRFTAKRLEFFYKILEDHTVSYKGKNILFRKGDEIIVGTQYKYYQKELARFFQMYFGKVKVICDPSREYCLFVCKK